MTDEKAKATDPAPFGVESEEVGGVRVIAVRGELDLSTAPQLEDSLRALEPDRPPLLIDLAECKFIDSTGIALLVRAWQQQGSQGDGGRFALCGVAEQVQRLLEITGLEAAIPMHHTRDEALERMRA